MSDGENWDWEAEIKKRFDPDNVTEWLEYSPELFIALMVNEIRRENEAISAWAKLLDTIPEFRNQTFYLNNQEIAATFFTETTMRAARIITRLLDTASAYREAVGSRK